MSYKITIEGATAAELRTNLLATVSLLGAQAAAAVDITEDPKPAAAKAKDKPAPKPSPEKAETTAASSSTPEQAKGDEPAGPTQADVLKAVLAYAGKTSKADAEALLAKFSASKVSELDAGDYPAVLAAIEEANSAGDLA